MFAVERLVDDEGLKGFGVAGESDDAVRNFCVVADQRARTAAVAVNRGGGANGTVPHASRRKSSPRVTLDVIGFPQICFECFRVKMSARLLANKSCLDVDASSVRRAGHEAWPPIAVLRRCR